MRETSFPRPAKLLIKGSPHGIVNLRRLKHFAVLCGVAHGIHDHHPVAFHDFCATEHTVGRERGIRIRVGRIRAFACHRFTGKRGFIHAHVS